jgi:hypothetical protein
MHLYHWANASMPAIKEPGESFKAVKQGAVNSNLI